MSEQKLFVFDIDGTLLDSQKQPLASTKQALLALKEAGHYVMIATGRSRYLAIEVIEPLAFDHYIICNGSAAFINHQQIYKRVLPEEQMQAYLQEAKELAIDVAYVGLDTSKRASTFHSAIMDEAMQSFGAQTPELDVDFPKKNDVYQMLAYYDDAYEHYFDERYDQLSFVRWHPKCVDVIPKGGSKATTMLKVAEHLGLSATDVIAFGDGLNDCEMLQAAGVGVAMGNASEEVRQYADMVTDTNDNDGIWQALVQLGFLTEMKKVPFT